MKNLIITTAAALSLLCLANTVQAAQKPQDADQETPYAQPAPQGGGERQDRQRKPATEIETLADLSQYPVGPGDVLQISVWKEEELTRKLAVRPDGGISFPLIGNLQVEGLRVEQIESVIKERLANFISDPEVSVDVVAVNHKIFVVGKVNKPGEYVTPNPVDVMQALSMAGGLTPFADEDDIKIIRRTHGQVTTFSFDYDDVSSGENLEQNILLQRGDVVVVP